MTRFLAALAALLTLSLAPTAWAQTPTKLPVIESPAPRAGDTMAIFYSGDGGWAALDKQVAAGLNARGVSVVGVDSLRYFLARHEPQAAADDLAALIEQYSRAWNRPRVILAGYSWGADILPLIVDKLPPAVRAKVRLVALVSPDETAELQFHLTDWIGHRAPDAIPLGPAVAAMKGTPSLCIYGESEAKSGCAGFAASIGKTVRLPGSHHLGGRYDLIAGAIAQGLGG